MRGKAMGLFDYLRQRRITPAYAGKRSTAFDVGSTVQDHPRLCGEKDFSAKTSLHDLGSPPPMRGKDAAAPVVVRTPRITPAYAGKRKICQYPRSLFQDHPRLCGEKSRNISQVPTMQGSPPPMRGKDHGKGLYLHVDGITPAYAGKRTERDQ